MELVNAIFSQLSFGESFTQFIRVPLRICDPPRMRSRGHTRNHRVPHRDSRFSREGGQGTYVLHLLSMNRVRDSGT
jgi:hypothetical protein